MRYKTELKKLLKWVSIGAVTLLLFKAGQAHALAQRGFQAVGGEYFIFAIPAIYWIYEDNLKKTKAALCRALKRVQKRVNT